MAVTHVAAAMTRQAQRVWYDMVNMSCRQPIFGPRSGKNCFTKVRCLTLCSASLCASPSWSLAEPRDRPLYDQDVRKGTYRRVRTRTNLHSKSGDAGVLMLGRVAIVLLQQWNLMPVIMGGGITGVSAEALAPSLFRDRMRFRQSSDFRRLRLALCRTRNLSGMPGIKLPPLGGSERYVRMIHGGLRDAQAQVHG